MHHTPLPARNAEPMARLLLATTWILTLVVVTGVGLLLYSLGGPTASIGPGAPPGPRIRATPAGDGWRVIRHLSAHHVAVIDVETGRPQDARRIAVALIQGLEPGYAEVLIYFHRPGSRDELPSRRIQWSPVTGYLEAIYDRRESVTPTSRP